MSSTGPTAGGGLQPYMAPSHKRVAICCEPGPAVFLATVQTQGPQTTNAPTYTHTSNEEATHEKKRHTAPQHLPVLAQAEVPGPFQPGGADNRAPFNPTTLGWPGRKCMKASKVTTRGHIYFCMNYKRQRSQQNSAEPSTSSAKKVGGLPAGTRECTRKQRFSSQRALLQAHVRRSAWVSSQQRSAMWGLQTAPTDPGLCTVPHGPSPTSCFQKAGAGQAGKAGTACDDRQDPQDLTACPGTFSAW